MMCTVCGVVCRWRGETPVMCRSLHVQTALSYIYARRNAVGRTLNFNIGPVMRNRSKRRRMSNQQCKP